MTDSIQSKLSDARRDIDRADRDIVTAIAERLKAVERVAEVKRLQGLPVYDPVREASLLYKLESLSSGQTAEVTLPVYRTLMAAARRFEKTGTDTATALSGELTLTLLNARQFTEVMAIFAVHNVVPERLSWVPPVMMLSAETPLPASLVRDLTEHGVRIEVRHD